MPPASFESLVAEGDAEPVEGWGFSWFEGRATEERPPWGYARQMSERMGQASAALDVQTGGGEVLAGIAVAPPLLAATESWGPNIAIARENLARFGATVVLVDDEADLPFSDGRFDLVVSRHPTTVRWDEIARVLQPGGIYFAQHISYGTNRELIDFMMGPQTRNESRRPDVARAEAETAGLDVLDVQECSLRVEFYDIAAVVFFLRKVLWTVPGFTSVAYKSQLERLHNVIVSEGAFVSHSTRFLIEARKSD